jgi:hypothetical protein
VGEGAMAAQLVHQYLCQIADTDREPIARIAAAARTSDAMPGRLELVTGSKNAR